MRAVFLKLLFAAAIAALLGASSASAQEDTACMIKSKAGPLKIERLATLEEPWGMTFLPDGRLLVTEKPGRMRIYSDGKVSDPVSGVPAVVYHEQGGLLDVEVSPDFATNGLVYLYYVEAAENQPNVGGDIKDARLGPYQDLKDNVLKGGAVACGRLVNNGLVDVKVIWRQVPKTIARNHFGGRLVFAPDGLLFITSGDRQRFEPAQETMGNLGKVVRIKADGSIPRDNPYANSKSMRQDIWSLGHRNPLGAAINPATSRLWMHEMGPKNGDEINTPEKGKNYGWPVVSNGDHYDGTKIPDHATRPQYTGPLTYWYPAISPSGMIFYRGTRFKDWNGNVLIGGLSSEALIRLTLDGNNIKSEERINLNKRIRDVIQAPDGAVWLLTDYKDGELLRVTPIR
ncbi:MAG: PQQ-dependent sugar dehydrogenase [Chitinophagaceae bacterium]|nr:PQQ-dependent sugar dehydrogenase [Chitinophagaceae bacterium]